ALVLEDARVILRHLRSGGGWGVPGLRPRVLRDRRYLLRTTVNGRRLDSLSMVEKFVEVLETREALTRMWNLWNGFVEAASETRERAVLRLSELHNALEDAFTVAGEHTALRQQIDAMAPGGACLGCGADEGHLWIRAIELLEVKDWLLDCRRELEAHEAVLVEGKAIDGSHDVVQRLVDGLRSRDVDAWSAAYSE